MSGLVCWMGSGRWVILAGIMGCAVGYASSPEPSATYSSEAVMQSVGGAVSHLFGGLLGISIAHAQEPPAVTTLGDTKVEWMRDPDIVPYRDAYKYFEQYAECPAMQPRFNVAKSDKFDIKDLRIELVGDKTSLDVPVNADLRTIDVPNDKSALDDKAEFMVNQKRGVVKVGVDAVMKLPTSLDIHYRDLLGAVEQANRCEVKVAPVLVRIARKDYTGVRLRYGKEGVGAKVMLADGSFGWMTNENGDIFIALEKWLMDKNPEIKLSALPKAVWPAYTKPEKKLP
jgi:hypothetical protein